MIRKNYLKSIRKILKLNQSDVIDETITRNTISHIENQKISLTDKTIELILKSINSFLQNNKHIIRLDYNDLFEENRFMQKILTENLYKDIEVLIVEDVSDFRKALDKLTTILSEWDFPRIKVKLYNLMGDYYYNQYDYSTSTFYLNQSISSIYKFGSINMIAETILKLMRSEIMLNTKGTSIEIAKQLLSRKNEINLNLYLGIRFNSALIFKKNEDYLNALGEIEILEEYIHSDNLERYSDLLLLKAICYKCLNRYEEADNIFNLIVPMLSDDYYNTKLAHIYCNMLDLYVVLKSKIRISEILYSLFMLLPSLKQDSNYLPGIYIEIAHSYNYLNKPALAHKYYDLSIRHAITTNEFVDLSEALFHFVELSYSLNLSNTNQLSKLLIDLLRSTKIHFDDITVITFISYLNETKDYEELTFFINKLRKIKKEANNEVH